MKKEMEANIEAIENGFLLRFNWDEEGSKEDFIYDKKVVYCKSFRKVVHVLKENFGQ